MSKRIELTNQLAALGISGKVSIAPVCRVPQSIVTINGKRFGIYDWEKHTFVD